MDKETYDILVSLGILLLDIVSNSNVYSGAAAGKLNDYLGKLNNVKVKE